MLCSGLTAKVLAATVPLSLSPGVKYSEMQSAFSVSKRGESLEKKKVLLEIKLISEHTSRCTECVMEVLLCVLLMRPYQRERERQRGCVGGCVSTCYITESGGRECCLACHTTVALRGGGGERETACLSSVPQLGTLLFTTLKTPQPPHHQHLYRRACDGAEGHVE